MYAMVHNYFPFHLINTPTTAYKLCMGLMSEKSCSEIKDRPLGKTN